MDHNLKDLCRSIQQLICKDEVLAYNLPCENITFIWERDVLSLNKADKLVEFEVKVTRSDFKADVSKKKWMYFNDPGLTSLSITKLPNRLYYVVPFEMVSVDEVPKCAGLIYVRDGKLWTVKPAPIIHRQKHDREKIVTKFTRVLTERLYLGNCRLTYENNKIKERNKNRLSNPLISPIKTSKNTTLII